MSRLPLIAAALAVAAVFCGGAKIAADQFIGKKAHDPRLVGAWKGRWVGAKRASARADVVLREDGTGRVRGREVLWNTEDAVLHLAAKSVQGEEFASVAYAVGQRGTSVAFDGGPAATVPLVMARP